MRNIILRKILNHLLKKSCPERISRSGEEGSKVNCFNIFIYGNNKPIMVVQNVTKTHFEGLIWDGTHFVSFNEIKLNSIKMRNIRINHNFGLYDICYNSFMHYMISGFTKVQIFKLKIQLAWNKSNQYIYNKKKFVSMDRLDLLRILVDHYLKSNGQGIGTIDLMTKLYTSRWILHPLKDKQETKLKLFLDSFIYSDDLEMKDGKYVVTGKSITTLSNYEEAERRHKNNRNLKRIMIFLTSILAFVSLAQIYFFYKINL